MAEIQKPTITVKKIAKKTTEKEVEVVKKAVVKKIVEKKENLNSNLEVSVFDTTGKVVEKITLPSAFFGEKVNKELLAQAVRVHLVNMRLGSAVTLTRGEVAGSTRKIYRQKGTGRARHGGIRAPLFVKGGIAHGPKSKDYKLSFPKKMVKKALISALSAKAIDKKIFVVSGVEALSGKTKQISIMFEKLGLLGKKNNLLFVLPFYNQKIFRSARNIGNISVTTAKRISTYEVIKYKALVFMKEAVETLSKEVKESK